MVFEFWKGTKAYLGQGREPNRTHKRTQGPKVQGPMPNKVKASYTWHQYIGSYKHKSPRGSRAPYNYIFYLSKKLEEKKMIISSIKFR